MNVVECCLKWKQGKKRLEIETETMIVRLNYHVNELGLYLEDTE